MAHTDESRLINSDNQESRPSITASNGGGGEEDSLLPQNVRVYKRRWFILAVFALEGFMQCAVWNTWGPITKSVQKAFPDWTDKMIALLSMWGTITMLIGLVPIGYALHRFGLRKTLLASSLFMTIGTGLRCISIDAETFTTLAHAGAILNGFAGVIVGMAPSLVSSRWFPAHERTTATAVGCTFNQLGNAGGFFLGPWLLHVLSDSGSTKEFKDPNDHQDMREAIRVYMAIVFAICSLLSLLVIAYFPEHPPNPPSVTSAIASTRPAGQDIVSVTKNYNFWLLMIPYSLSVGLNVAWSSVIEINVDPLGVNQSTAAWLGIGVTFGGVIVALLAAQLTDRLFGCMKVTIIGMEFFATCGFTWFLLITIGCIPFSLWQLFISVIIGASFSYGTSPLFFEFAVELCYPVNEGIIGCFLNMCWNVVSALFLFIFQFTHDSVVWMDYVLAIQGVICIVGMLFVKEQYNRSHVDRGDSTNNEPTDINTRPSTTTISTTGIEHSSEMLA